MEKWASVFLHLASDVVQAEQGVQILYTSTIYQGINNTNNICTLRLAAWGYST